MKRIPSPISTSFALLLLLLVLSSFSPSTAMASSKSWFGSKSPKTTMNDQQITLPTSGILAQVISSLPQRKTNNPPIIFLHGSFHAAWCWQQNYIPYFVEKGFPCIALSWRGTGGTPAGENVTKVKISEHCEDFQGLLESIPSILGSQYQNCRPIVVAHSMGGIYVMKYLEEQSEKGKLPRTMFSGIASVCSVAPSGNGKSTMRVMWRSFKDAYRITVGFVLKRVNTDASICRQCFFGGEPKVSEDGSVDNLGISDEDIARYQRYFERDSQAVLDVMDLSKQLPSKQVDKQGRAPFVHGLPPCLVVGAKDDFIVDDVAVMETAKYYGVDNPVYIDSPHDVMLTNKWKNGAEALCSWIEDNVLDK